ncbi:MAG: hypothetical protein DWQ40_07785 [Actinobacteria bacterium]|nr:MAG: hypothetical protein DWQ40_07785 [Actinomycetota bacterium]REK40803.1 MAG: hypothetical protein DWQ20_01110 [Actinomycetota bacterium]
MSEPFEIRGGADEFEAAVIAVVLDHIRAEERARQTGRNPDGNRLPSWIRAIDPRIYPEHPRP